MKKFIFIIVKVMFVIVGASIGASLMTIFFLPFCFRVTGSIGYCMPPVDWLVSLFVLLVSEGGAPGVFGIIWLNYFLALLVVLTIVALAIRRRRSTHKARGVLDAGGDQ